jgi:tRNA uridine 5-carboxymethylaminomethyl modification enzyme
MLTARAEYRLRLRANNAATRLTPLGIESGCIGRERKAWFEQRENARAAIGTAFDQKIPARELADKGMSVRRDGGEKPISEWLRHESIDVDALSDWVGETVALDPLLAGEMAEDATYEPYLARQDAELRDLRASESLSLPPDFPYASVPGLSNEMVERLSAVMPTTLAAAGRVPGVTPAALSALLVHARRHEAALDQRVA